MKNWRKLILVLAGCANIAFAAPQELDKIAVIVNNGVVLESDVNNLLQLVKFHAHRDGRQLPEENSLRLQIMERLIMDNIQLQIAKKMGITVSNVNLDKSIASIAEKNKMKLDQLRNRLSYEGLSYNSYRSEIRKEMLISQVLNNEVRRRVSILPKEIEALEKSISTKNINDIEMNISHILLYLPKNPLKQQVDNAQALAKKLIRELHEGADFGKLAIIYSVGPKELQGGNMGWERLQKIPEFLAKQLVNAKKGMIIGPIQSNAGIHILKVNGIRNSGQLAAITEVHARHILIKPSITMTDEQISAKLEKVAADIKNGRTRFAKEAQKLSQDSNSSFQGGDLGWVFLDSYDPGFRDVLLKLNKGDISTPVHSAFGWHLIQLLDRRQVVRTDAEQKNRAYRILFNRKFEEEALSWMQELRAKAYVKILNSHTQP